MTNGYVEISAKTANYQQMLKVTYTIEDKIKDIVMNIWQIGTWYKITCE